MVQRNPYQNSDDILHQDRKVSPKVHIDADKTFEQPKQSWAKRAILTSNYTTESKYLSSNYTTEPQ
jgi:hypothetical protein